MPIPTEPIGSIPRPHELIAGLLRAADGRIASSELEALFDHAARDTIARFEATGSPVVTDGEQRKPSFATYPIAGLHALAPAAPAAAPPRAQTGGCFACGAAHPPRRAVLPGGPFRYRTHADSYLVAA